MEYSINYRLIHKTSAWQWRELKYKTIQTDKSPYNEKSLTIKIFFYFIHHFSLTNFQHIHQKINLIDWLLFFKCKFKNYLVLLFFSYNNVKNKLNKSKYFVILVKKNMLFLTTSFLESKFFFWEIYIFFFWRINSAVIKNKFFFS